MEAFEQFVAVALAAEGLVVSSNLKFPIARQTRKKTHTEIQEHSYEIDLAGARGDRLVLVSVKSYFGSKGVRYADVSGTGKNSDRYMVLNDPAIRDGVIAGAAERYGYRKDQITLRLAVGRFAGKTDDNERMIRDWCAGQLAGAGAIELVTVREIVERVRSVAQATTYVDNPVLVALKVLAAAGVLDLEKPVGEITNSMLADLGVDDGDADDDDANE